VNVVSLDVKLFQQAHSNLILNFHALKVLHLWTVHRFHQFVFLHMLNAYGTVVLRIVTSFPKYVSTKILALKILGMICFVVPTMCLFRFRDLWKNFLTGWSHIWRLKNTPKSLQVTSVIVERKLLNITESCQFLQSISMAMNDAYFQTVSPCLMTWFVLRD
jgi:hypothetical protein